MTIINGERAKLPSSLCNNEISSIFNEDQLAGTEGEYYTTEWWLKFPSTAALHEGGELVPAEMGSLWIEYVCLYWMKSPEINFQNGVAIPVTLLKLISAVGLLEHGRIWTGVMVRSPANGTRQAVPSDAVYYLYIAIFHFDAPFRPKWGLRWIGKLAIYPTIIA